MKSFFKYLAFFGFLYCGLSASAQTPSTHSSNVSVNALHCQQVSISWTKGDGSQRIILVKEGSAVNGTPAENSFYSTSDTIGDGDQIGSGNYVVYNSNGTATTIYGLKKNTTYHIAIFEFNGGGSSFNYLTSGSYATANFTTEDINARFSIDDTYQCLSGNSFSYSNSSSQTKSGSISYDWDFGDNQTSSATDPTHQYVAGGIFNVDLTAYSTGCSHTYSLRDTVLVPYIVDFELDPTVSGNDSIQCLEGNYFQFSNLSRIPASPIYGTYDAANYRWSTSDGQSGNLYNVNFSFNQPGSIDIKLIVRRKVAPKGDFCSDSITKRFVVLPDPLTNANVVFSDTALCLSDNQFDFSHDATGIASTKWDFGDGNASFNNPAQHVYSFAGIFPVKLNVIDNNGCTDEYEDTVEVFDEPNNFFTGLDPVYCLNDPKVTLRPNLGGGIFQGMGVDATDSSFTPNQVGTWSIRYVYIQGNCRDTTVQQTEVLDVPVFDLGRDTFLCSGASIDLDPGSDTLNYQWSDGSRSSSRTVSAPGRYILTVSDGSCSTSDTIDVTQLNPPSFDLGLDTTLCGGQSITLYFSAESATYTWNDGYPTQSGQRTITESGYYEVTVSNACGSITDDVTIDILPFACEIFVPNAFSPNGDKLNDIFRPSGFFEFTDMTIFNEYGEILFFTDKEETGWDGNYQDEPVQSGIYYFHIRYQLPEFGSMVKKSSSGFVWLVR